MKLCGFLCTCPVAQSEVGALVFNATDVPDGGEAGVVGVILRTQILQLQNLCLSLKHKRTSLNLFQVLQGATCLIAAVKQDHVHHQLQKHFSTNVVVVTNAILCLLWFV